MRSFLPFALTLAALLSLSGCGSSTTQVFPARCQVNTNRITFGSILPPVRGWTWRR